MRIEDPKPLVFLAVLSIDFIMMKDTKGKIIIKDGDYAIYKTVEPIMGGNYSVINSKDKTAKSGLCLDGAYEIFKQLTLEATLMDNNMI